MAEQPLRLPQPALEIVMVQRGASWCSSRKGHAARIYTPFDPSFTEEFMDSHHSLRMYALLRSTCSSKYRVVFISLPGRYTIRTIPSLDGLVPRGKARRLPFTWSDSVPATKQTGNRSGLWPGSPALGEMTGATKGVHILKEPVVPISG